MTTLTESCIASQSEFPRTLPDESSIATEPRSTSDQAWAQCVDALRKAWKDPSVIEDGRVTPPTRNVIEAAIQWLRELREHAPLAPPTLIVPEPGGGIIIERRERTTTGDDVAVELTLYNHGEAEQTIYRNGRLVEMFPIPFRPPRRGSSR